MRRFVFVLLLAAAGCGGADSPSTDPVPNSVVRSVQSSGGGGPGQVEVIGGDEAALRDFIGRALTYPAPVGTSDDVVLIGALPVDLPLDLPLPEGSRVVGSTVRTAPYGGAEVILDVPLTVDEAMDFYRERLQQAGWDPAPEPSYGGGFTAEPWPSATFCLNQNRAQIFVSARPVADQPTDLRLSIQSEVEYSACDPQSMGPNDQASSMIPELTTPGGSVIESSSGSGGDGRADTSATLRTELSPTDLAAGYAGQLRQAGWERVFEQSVPELAWSTWTTTDADGQAWAGMLLVSDQPLQADQVFAWFRVERGE